MWLSVPGDFMAKWEYQFLVAEKHGKGIFGFAMPREISWKVHYVNGKQVTNWGDCTLFNYLNKAGEDGWEMVSHSSHMNMRTGSLPVEHMYLVLKREKDHS